jgi:hypothetical protein
MVNTLNILNIGSIIQNLTYIFKKKNYKCIKQNPLIIIIYFRMKYHNNN